MSIFSDHTHIAKLKILARQQLEAYRYLAALVKSHGHFLGEDRPAKLEALGHEADAVHSIHDAMESFCNSVAAHLHQPTIASPLKAPAPAPAAPAGETAPAQPTEATQPHDPAPVDVPAPVEAPAAPAGEAQGA